MRLRAAVAAAACLLYRIGIDVRWKRRQARLTCAKISKCGGCSRSDGELRCASAAPSSRCVRVGTRTAARWPALSTKIDRVRPNFGKGGAPGRHPAGSGLRSSGAQDQPALSALGRNRASAIDGYVADEESLCCFVLGATFRDCLTRELQVRSRSSTSRHHLTCGAASCRWSSFELCSAAHGRASYYCCTCGAGSVCHLLRFGGPALRL